MADGPPPPNLLAELKMGFPKKKSKKKKKNQDRAEEVKQ